MLRAANPSLDFTTNTAFTPLRVHTSYSRPIPALRATLLLRSSFTSFTSFASGGSLSSRRILLYFSVQIVRASVCFLTLTHSVLQKGRGRGGVYIPKMKRNPTDVDCLCKSHPCLCPSLPSDLEWKSLQREVGTFWQPTPAHRPTTGALATWPRRNTKAQRPITA